jgi:hypothetical protein
MDSGDDIRIGQHRSMVCEPGTARSMAGVLVRLRVLRPAPILWLLFVGVLAAMPLAIDGYLVGAVVQGVLSVLFLTALLVFATYRRTRRATESLYPAGAAVSVDLAADTMTVRTAVGESQLRYSALRAPQVVDGHVVLPLRAARLRVTLPPGLLTPFDVEWLRDRIIRSESEPPAALVADAGSSTDIGGEVVVTAEMAERARREVLRYRLRGRGAVSLALISIGLGLVVGGLTGWWLAGVAVMLLVAVAFLVLITNRITRALQRTSGVGRRVRARFDDTHVHFESDGVSGSLAYSAIRRCVFGGGVVLLSTTTGVLQVIPQEIVPDDAVRLLTSAQPAR